MDIADKNNTDVERISGKESYHNLVEIIPCGIEEIDTEGTIVLSNKRHHDIMGYEYGELQGKKIWDLAASQEIQNQIKRDFAGMLDQQSPPTPFTWRKTRKDGKEITVRVVWNYKRNAQGELIGFIGVVTDITQQNHTLDEVSNLEDIVHQSNDCIVLTDTDGAIQYVNSAFEVLTGYTFDEVKGKNPRILKSPNNSYPPGYYKKMWDQITSGKVWKGEFLNMKKNGQEFNEEASIFPLRDRETGHITGYGAIKKDITRRRELEKQLQESYHEVVQLKEKAEEANRLKSQFLATMSHDIRTPLNAIMGFTDLLAKGERRKEPQDFLKNIKNAGEVLVNVIGDVLDFSKIEAGQLDIFPQTFSVKDLNKHICSMFELQLKQKGLRFKTGIDSNVPMVIYNDKWRINQVVTNLLSNAQKFTENGTVYYYTHYRDTDDTIIFQVKDTGIGIEPQNLEQIFNPFNQVRLEGVNAQKGTGLGLAICRSLTQLMGGTITVESMRGKGTEFNVSLPANSEKARAGAIREPISRKREIQLKGKTDNLILIAEDNSVNRELLSEQLKSAGFQNLLTAENGLEAVEIALSKKPDLILMDIQMPVMNGNEAIEHLREKNCLAPVIVLSAFAMHEEIEKSLKAGAVEYVTKPIDFKSFFTKITPFLKTGKIASSKTDTDVNRQQDTGENLKLKDRISERMRNVFIKDVKAKLEKVNRAFEAGAFTKNRDQLKIIAHGYLGNAAYFELRALEKAAAELDKSLKDGETDSVVMTRARTLAGVLEDILRQNII